MLFLYLTQICSKRFARRIPKNRGNMHKTNFNEFIYTAKIQSHLNIQILSTKIPFKNIFHWNFWVGNYCIYLREKALRMSINHQIFHKPALETIDLYPNICIFQETRTDKLETIKSTQFWDVNSIYFMQYFSEIQIYHIESQSYALHLDKDFLCSLDFLLIRKNRFFFRNKSILRVPACIELASFIVYVCLWKSPPLRPPSLSLWRRAYIGIITHRVFRIK